MNSDQINSKSDQVQAIFDAKANQIIKENEKNIRENKCVQPLFELWRSAGDETNHLDILENGLKHNLFEDPSLDAIPDEDDMQPLQRKKGPVVNHKEMHGLGNKSSANGNQNPYHMPDDYDCSMVDAKVKAA